MGNRPGIALVLTAVLALAAASCATTDQPSAIDLGGGASVTTAPSATAPSATAPSATEPAATGPADTSPAATEQAASEPPATEVPRQRPEGPDASDFTLALGGPGGTFSLSEEARPVFMVFWAEW